MSRPKKSLIGMKFGRLLVTGEDGYNCICDCDCGTIDKYTNRYGLLKGNTLSCGCYQKEKLIKRNTIHGLCGTPLYRIWGCMKQRCENKNNKHYKDYGGRGIKIYEEWSNSPEIFIKWAIENGWVQGLEIDRINNDGDYEPNNCQFITPKENNGVGKKRMKSDNSSGYIGVTFEKCKNRWRAYIQLDKKLKNLGYFKTIEEAVECRINKEIEIYGEQKTNFHYNKIG